MDGRLFTTPDRILAAAASFTAEGYEQTFEALLPDPVPWPTRGERPLRPMRSACRPLDATAATA
ncbi:MAG: hypothetical protein BGO97_03245 [Micrococcales bacterium 70-64]|nr:hypothetical protein [Leifsonia sp.]ODU63136.1 MAG: hypothetical protein ABT06_03250 [Leifsonia sp. SCN 70-46]OJX84827.1 MAG: hypothetical protein BGO97_03245 [Micrococcales bacterium 70-64]